MLSQNPYIAGNPVGGTPNFVGRADVLREVLRVMRQPHQNIIVLYGQRRIGKTSVLLQLAAELPKEGHYYPVYFDLQDKASWSLGRVLTDLARAISHDLARQGPPELRATGPLLNDQDPVNAFQKTWLPTLLQRLPEGHSIVLLFDEFDVLADPKGGQAGADLFPYLRGLLATDPTRLQFVFVIGRKVEDLESIALSLFKGAPSLRVSLLNKVDTFELARLSERNGTLQWSEESLEQVWELTHGHPFLTQQLCSRLWENLYDTDPTGIPTVIPDDVERAIPETLEASRNTLEWLWDGLPPAERVVISALAGAGNRAITQPQLEQLLRESGVRVVIRELQNAPQLLQDWDLIEPAEGGFCFRVELFRQWILEHKPLSRVQEELDRIEPLAENLYQAAYGFFRNNQLEDALPLLRQAIGLNPNHARSRQLLAEIFLLRGEVDQAVQILQMLYDTQPAIARPRLVQALILKGEEETDEAKRLDIYEQILRVDPSHPVAAQKIADLQWAIRQRELSQRLEELQKTEKEKRYRDALELARKLAEKYPDQRDWLPDLDRLERKTKLADDYQRAIGALNSGDRDAAMRGFAELLALEPDYEEATRYLHQAKTGQDPVHLLNQLAGEQKAHNRLKTRLEEESVARAEAEKQRDELQIRLESEKELSASYRRMSWRMTYWAIGSSLLALGFFIAWLLRGQAIEQTSLAYTQTAIAVAEMNLTQVASFTPEMAPSLTPNVTEPQAEDTPDMTPTPEVIVTTPLTDTATPELTPTSNPFAGPVPKTAFARLGKGRILSAALSPDGQWFAVGSTTGVFVYRADTFEEVWSVPLQTGVLQVAFSPDSAVLAIGSYTVELLNVTTGEFYPPLEQQDILVKSLAFSPTGNQIAAGTIDGRIITWDTANGTALPTLVADDSSVLALAFSSKNVLVAGTQNGKVFLWNDEVSDNADEAKSELGQHENAVTSLAFSGDGSLLVSGGEDAQVRLWDVAAQSQLDVALPVPIDDAVFSLALAPADATLAVGLASGEIVVWDLLNASDLQTIPAHTYRVTSLAFYPDGTLFSASEDNTVVHADRTSGIMLQRLDGFTAAVLTSAYSPEGDVFATGDEYGNILIWDTATNSLIQTLTGSWGRVYAVAFAPLDSNTLVAGYANGQLVLWDRQTGQATELGEHSNRITALAFSPNSQYLVSAAEEPAFVVWNLATNLPEASVGGDIHTDWVESLAFSPNGESLASGSSDGHIYLWNPANWELFDALPGHTETEGRIESLSFSSDSRWLASGATDNLVKVWDMTGAEEPRTLIGHSSTVWSVAFSSAETNLLASGSLDADVILWNVQTEERFYTFIGHGEQVHSVSFAPNGKVLASGSSDGTVILWDTNPEQLFNFSGDHGRVNAVDFSAQGNLLASAAEDGTITLWNVNTGVVSDTLTGPAEALSVAFSPVENAILAAGFANGDILLWNLKNPGEAPRSFSDHTDAVYALAFSTDGSLLASGSADTLVILWDIANPETAPRPLQGHDSTVYSLAFSPDGTRLASGSQGGNVLLWNVAISRFVTTLNEGGHLASVFGLAYLDDTFLASASDDQKIILWNVASNQKNEDFAEEPSGILSLDFDGANTLLATGNRDGQVYLWPVAGGDPFILSGHAGVVYSVAFSPNGQLLASASEDGTIILWELENILP
ncbi:MAG: hypothetical protein Fur0022_30950 [Anaerolineales bacterium]